MLPLLPAVRNAEGRKLWQSEVTGSRFESGSWLWFAKDKLMVRVHPK